MLAQSPRWRQPPTPFPREGLSLCALPLPSSRTVSVEDHGRSGRRGHCCFPQLIEEVLVPHPVGMRDPTLCLHRSDLSCQSNIGHNLSDPLVETVVAKTEQHAFQVKGISSLDMTTPICNISQAIGRHESLSASAMEGLTPPPLSLLHVPEMYLGLLHEPKGQS